MVTLAKLLLLIKEFMAGEFDKWGRLAFRGDKEKAFCLGLANAVKLANDCTKKDFEDFIDSSFTELRNCLKDNRFAEQITNHYKFKGWLIDEFTLSRLLVHGKALVETAYTACLAKQVVQTNESIQPFIEQAQNTIDVLSNTLTQTKDVVSLKLSTIEQWGRSTPSELISQCFDDLIGEKRLIAKYWSLYWLGEHVTLHLTDKRNVSVFGYSSYNKAHRSNVNLQKLTTGNERVLFEHPESSLLPLGKDLLEGIERAWQQTDKVSVCWEFSSVRNTFQDGDSLSAAVGAALATLAQNSYYDCDKVILGAVSKDGSENLVPVGNEYEKLRAAVELGIKLAAVVKGVVKDVISGIDSKDRITSNEIANLKDLTVREITTLEQAVDFVTIKECSRYFVEKLPDHFLPRSEEVQEIKKMLLNSQVVGQTSSHKVSLHGMGGIGKTLLARELAYSKDPDIWKAFPDGIFWVDVGKTATEKELSYRQKGIIGKLLKEEVVLNDKIDSKAKLQETLASKKCLIILDDIWTREQFDAFDVLSHTSKMLITSRDGELLTVSANTQVYSVKGVHEDLAMEMLAEYAEQSVGSLPREAYIIVEEWCRYLPFGLALCGSLVKGSKLRWENVLTILEKNNLPRLKTSSHNLEDLIKISVEALGEDKRSYHALVVFRRKAKITAKAIITILGSKPYELEEYEAEILIATFVNRALLSKTGDDTYELHDLLYIYLFNKANQSKPELSRTLLKTYKKKHKDWTKVEEDVYLYQNLAYHLQRAKYIKELKNLLLNYYWLEKKLAVTDIDNLLSDYTFYPFVKKVDEDVELVYKVLEQKSYILRNKKNQLASQLLGAINTQFSHSIERLLNKASQNKAFPWLKPLSNSLTCSSELVATFNAHSDSVRAIAVYQDRCTAISASDDSSLIIWDLHEKKMIRIISGELNFRVNSITIEIDKKENKMFALLACDDHKVRICDLAKEPKDTFIEIFTKHKGPVTAIKLYERENNLFAISASEDGKVGKWNVNDPQKVSEVFGDEKCKSFVNSVAVCEQDGKNFAVSGSKDATLKVWDLDNNSPIATLSDHLDAITSVAVYKQGGKTFVVSGSKDTTLKVWDLDNNSPIATLYGHLNEITSVAVYKQNGKNFAISASEDKTLKMWDLETTELIKTLHGHSREIKSVAVYEQDGKNFAISASGDKTLKIWSLINKKNTDTPHQHLSRVTSIITYKKGEEIFAISSSYDKTLKIWSLTTKQEIRTIESHTNEIRTIANYEKKSKSFLISASYEELQMWNLDDLETIEPRKIFKQKDRICSVKIYYDNDRVFAISASQDKNLKIWDLDSEELPKLITVHSPISTMTVYKREDKNFVIFTLEDKTLKIAKLAFHSKFEEHQTCSSDSLITAIDIYEKKGKYFALTGSQNGILEIWDLDNLKCRELCKLAKHSTRIRSLAIIKQNDTVFAISASEDYDLKVWNLNTQKEITSITLESFPTTVKIVKDLILVGDVSGQVHFFQLVNILT